METEIFNSFLGARLGRVLGIFRACFVLKSHSDYFFLSLRTRFGSTFKLWYERKDEPSTKIVRGRLVRFSSKVNPGFERRLVCVSSRVSPS